MVFVPFLLWYRGYLYENTHSYKRRGSIWDLVALLSDSLQLRTNTTMLEKRTDEVRRDGMCGCSCIKFTEATLAVFQKLISLQLISLKQETGEYKGASLFGGIGRFTLGWKK